MKELDRFLIGEVDSYNWNKYEHTRYSLARILHSDSFYFIYQGSLEDIKSYNARFDFLGIFDNINRKIYLESDYYNLLTESEFPKEVISKVINQLDEDVKVAYNEYINKHKGDIKAKAYPKFKEYYGYQENKTTLDNTARESFIQDNFTELKIFGFPYEVGSVEDLLKYIRNKENLIQDKIQSVEDSTTESRKWGNGPGNSTDVSLTELEKVGFRLLEVEYFNDVKDRIEKGNYAESKKLLKLRAIVKFATENKNEMKNVLVTVKHNGQELEFKYSLESIGYLHISEYNVEVAKREEFEKLFEDVRWGNDKDRIAEITQMKYRGKVVFDEGDI